MALKEKAVKLTGLAAVEAENAVIKNESIQHYIFLAHAYIPVWLTDNYIWSTLLVQAISLGKYLALVMNALHKGAVKKMSAEREPYIAINIFSILSNLASSIAIGSEFLPTYIE